MSVTSPASRTAPGVATARAGILAATVAIALALNAVIAAIAAAAGAGGSYAPLNAPVYGAFTVAAITVGWFVWHAISRRVANPRRTMPIIAAVVLVLSFVPDVVLLVTGFIPGTTTAGVIALMAMHVVVMVTAVGGYTLAERR